MTVVTVGPHDDPRCTWTAVGKAVSATGLRWLPATRLALAAIDLVGDPGETAVITVSGDAARAQASVRGGSGDCTRLPERLADACLHPGAGNEHVVVVTDGLLPAAGLHAPSGTLADDCTPERLLGIALVAIQDQARRLEVSEAENREFQIELAETNRGLLAVVAELQTANQRIADLLAMLSHDIRQPLGVITSYCALLLEDWDELAEAQRRRDLARISTASLGMSELVEEILTLSQITADELSTRPAPVRISSAVAEAVADVATPEAGTVTVRGGDDCCVLVDPRHLHRILTNLVSNALKYGAPPVEISAVDAGDAVEISVRDHGEGVPAEFQPRLFGRFTRADTPATRAKKGTGLGLYIVRKLAEANDGAVTYRNHPAGGGCFTLRLPGGRQPADTA